MTTPSERTRHLVQTGAFLKELCAHTSIPDDIQREARRLLRHYPTWSELHLLAQIEAKSIGSNLLSEEFDMSWIDAYHQGAHTCE